MDFYVCKECGVEKPIEEYYRHPDTKDGISHRCKECIIKGRKSDHEVRLRRIRGRERYKKDKKRRDFVNRNSSERRRRKGYGAVHSKTLREIRKRHCRPNKCSVCGGCIDYVDIFCIDFHHIDYKVWNIGIFCCRVCHKKIERGVLDYRDYPISNLLNLQYEHGLCDTPPTRKQRGRNTKQTGQA